MRPWRSVGLLLAPVLLSLVVAACSSKTTTGTSASTPPASATPTPTPSPPTPGGSTAATSAPSGAPQNLVVTDALRADLVQAGAQSHGLPASDYTGLVPGMTYYALDSGTGISWAGAGLVPSSSSLQAQVANQDDGAYLLFEKVPGGQWVAHNDGYGAPPGTGCPAPLPASIIALWHWDAATCHPASSAPGPSPSPSTASPSFVGQWSVHGETLQIGATSATLVSNLGPCSPPAQGLCHETDTMSATLSASGGPGGGVLTLVVTSVAFGDGTGAPVTAAEAGSPVAAVGDSLQLTVVAPGLLKRAIVHGFAGLVGGNANFCGAAVSPANQQLCGA